MDGEDAMNVALAVEICVDFFQSFVDIAFLYLFFEKSGNKLKNALGFWSTVALSTAIEIFNTFNDMAEGHADFHLGLLLAAYLIRMLYVLFFLKGKLYLKLLMVLATAALYMLVDTALATLAFSNPDLADFIQFSSFNRYNLMIVENVVYTGVLAVILLTGKQKIRLRKVFDKITAIVITALVCLSLFAAELLFVSLSFNGSDSVILYTVIIILSLVVLSVLFWVLLFKISKANEVHTELLLGKQREELYKTSVAAANAQIEAIAEMKHDMKNSVMSVGSLIAGGEYEKARALCDSVNEKLTAAFTPAHTANPVLNAILNVETEKAATRAIDFSVDIQDDLSFVSDSDLISIIGNLCDNAIEYLSAIPESQRRMRLKIKVHRGYYCITCKNTILESVLETNPDLNSTKDDAAFHGKGIKLLKQTAEKYQGEFVCSEENDQFIISAIIRNSN